MTQIKCCAAFALVLLGAQTASAQYEHAFEMQPAPAFAPPMMMMGPTIPPAAQRMHNVAADPTVGVPGSVENFRGGVIPPYDPGKWREQPPGAGKNDPWRPPHHWPQTRYPVVPAYAQPNFGYFETSWRTMAIGAGTVSAKPAPPRTNPAVLPKVETPPVKPPEAAPAPKPMTVVPGATELAPVMILPESAYDQNPPEPEPAQSAMIPPEQAAISTQAF